MVLLETDSTLRTDESISQKAHEEHHVKGKPLVHCLSDLCQIPFDYMHLVYIGVTKQWLPLKTKATKPSLPAASLKEASKFNLRPYYFAELARLPPPLKEFGFWKARELRSFLLYLRQAVLTGIL